MIVIDEHDPSRAYEPTEKDEVEEDAVEAMVAVDEREVKAPAFAEKSRQCDLRLLRVVFHQLRDPRLLEKLQTTVGEPRRLVGVEDHVSRRRTGVLKQALANMES
jgi:hypothetical protein